ncbi:hypothetical protein LY474_19675 [Myxococcus stipitatus]|uniref:hypothetical protein n=1 Tax=Myxococcus stipitatus TaxID=83455 RepID=UPI001F226C85|nr:hypothetical protein [Myxococcus stipitatus]MCE9670022.1 hypothetical protein [Myxococcus stipitatus]
MTRALAVGSLISVLLAATPARASTPAQEALEERAPALVSWKRALCIYTGCFLEPLVPDVRYEWGPRSREHWVLSWPVHPWALPAWDVPGPTLVLSPFVEPQLRLSPSAFRMLGGARLYVFPDTWRLGALVEGAGLWGRDGSGGLVGMGASFDFIERHRDTVPWTASVVLRRTWTGEGARLDVSFDIAVPLNMFQGTARNSGDAVDQPSH